MTGRLGSRGEFDERRACAGWWQSQSDYLTDPNAQNTSARIDAFQRSLDQPEDVWITVMTPSSTSPVGGRRRSSTSSLPRSECR